MQWSRGEPLSGLGEGMTLHTTAAEAAMRTRANTVVICMAWVNAVFAASATAASAGSARSRTPSVPDRESPAVLPWTWSKSAGSATNQRYSADCMDPRMAMPKAAPSW